MGNAQSIYNAIVQKQRIEEVELEVEDYKLLVKKAHQGHIYGRTTHPSIEAKKLDGQRNSSTDGEWSDASGTRPETEAIRRDDSAAARESGAADGSTGETVDVAASSAKSPTGGTAKRGANRRQQQ